MARKCALHSASEHSFKGEVPMAIEIDFYFFYGSIHSYLSVMRIDAVAAPANVKINWRPFNLREILVEQNNTGFVKNDVKMNYLWHDIERRAVRLKIPFSGRAPYPADPDLLALRVGVIAAQEGWCREYSIATFHAWFTEHLAPGVGSHVERVLGSLNKDPRLIIDRAVSAEGDQLIEDVTDSARRRGIFGAPTFVAGSEIFWGDDRLEEALDFASRS